MELALKKGVNQSSELSGEPGRSPYLAPRHPSVFDAVPSACIGN